MREDARLGRRYLPADACAARGLVDPAAAPPGDPRFAALMEDGFARADAWYVEADAGIAALPPAVRAPIALARSLYSALHAAIRARGYALEPRVVVPWRAKLAAAAAVLPATAVLRLVAAEAAARAAAIAADWAAPAAVLLAVAAAAELVDVPGEVSYAAFHALWSAPIIVVALAYVAADRMLRRAGDAPPAYAGHADDATLVPKWAAALAVAALVYTTPWDAALITHGVWASTAVSATVFSIPVEEVAFFVTATLTAAAAWLASWPDRWADAERAPRAAAAAAGAAILAAAGAAGVALLAVGPDRTFYLGALLAWATPVLALQWAVGAHVLLAHAKPLVRAILLSGGALAIVDRWAIRRNVWVLSPEYSLPPWAHGTHPEEVLFFFLTAAMCAGGLTLALWVEHDFRPRLRMGPWTIKMRRRDGTEEDEAEDASSGAAALPHAEALAQPQAEVPLKAARRRRRSPASRAAAI